MKNIAKEHVYFIGICGKGLNSLAEYCISKGFFVSGSDIRRTNESDRLSKKGICINYSQEYSNINKKYTVVVYSSVIPENHPERLSAFDQKIKQMSRAEFLGYVTKDLLRISVAGSHGKSTTSALASIALEKESGGVNSITGAYIKEFDSYQKSTDSPYCVVESCEYAKSFLFLPGDYTIITSLEKSHMEYYKTEEKMNEAFRSFVRTHKDTSTFIINGDNPTLRQVCASHAGKVITCGFNSSNDFVIRDVKLDETYSVYSIFKENVCIEKNIKIQIPGTYNILNSAYVFILLRSMGYPTNNYRESLKKFTGVGRRFETVEKNGAIFIDDFAHHPTQVKNLIDGVKQFFPKKKILAVFEPRQYHLMGTFLREYGKSFKNVDEVYVTDIIPALADTKEDIEKLNIKDIISSIRTYSNIKNIFHCETYEKIAQSLLTKNLSRFVVLTIGAGPIYRVRDLLINKVQ